MPAKAVHLISPAYRRWLTPDFTELEFELENFDPKDQTPWQADLSVRDLDADAESRSLTPIDGTPKTFALPVPKFHRRAEIVLYVSDRRTKEPACEGCWRLTNIPKEDLPNLSYFDSRGVFFHEGQGRFPIVAWPFRRTPVSDWDKFAKAGFTGLMPPSDEVDDKSAALAATLKVLLFPLVLPKGETVDDTKKEVRRLQRYPVVAGYVGPLHQDAVKSFRAMDPSRPTVGVEVLDFDGEDLKPKHAAFQDVVALGAFPPKNGPFRPTVRRSGREHFALVAHDDALPAKLQSALYIAVARGAAALIVRIDERPTLGDDTAPLREAAPLVNAVVRGVPERSNESTANHWFWGRRLGPNEKAVIEVKRTDPPTATFTITRD